MQLPVANGLVTLTTDFGIADPYVGVMRGVVKQRYPRAEVLDFTHGVPAHDVRTGALFLGAARDRYPNGTVHVAVVDPGVGTERRGLAACAHGTYWVGPDNGLFSLVLPPDLVGCEVRALDLRVLRLPPPSRTFWGRDVFAPVAGLLSGGRFGFRAVGPRVLDPVRIPMPSPDRPEVVMVDGYGNLITSIPAAHAGGARRLSIGGREAPIRSAYHDAERGDVLALVNSYDLLEVAVCEGRACDVLGVGVGAAVALLAD